MKIKVYIQDFASLSAAGDNLGYEQALFAKKRRILPLIKDFSGNSVYFGKIDDRLILTEKDIKKLFPNCRKDSNLRWGRGNRITATIALEIAPTIQRIMAEYNNKRIALILGASVAGMTETEAYFFNGQGDSEFRDTDLEMFNPARALKALWDFEGPVYTISTACTSSTKAIIGAARLIQSGEIDAAICGGVDAMSLFTIAGFESLGAVSQNLSQPFGEHRDGINLGEGGALFVLESKKSQFELAGWAETSDAYHISSPDPTAKSVIKAISLALKMAHTSKPDYVCAHGTGTRKNDEMEAFAINTLLPDTPVSSTKTITGHTLGGAGALSAAAALLGLKARRLPIHHIEDTVDPRIAKILLVSEAIEIKHFDCVLCNSFAFGGNNAVILIKRT